VREATQSIIPTSQTLQSPTPTAVSLHVQETPRSPRVCALLDHSGAERCKIPFREQSGRLLRTPQMHPWDSAGGPASVMAAKRASAIYHLCPVYLTVHSVRHPPSARRAPRARRPPRKSPDGQGLLESVRMALW
jgi:hypothetical protein